MYQLPPIPARKKPRPAYKKPEAVKQLERLADAEARRVHPNIAPEYIAPRKYRDDNANGLTKCVIDFLKFTGNVAERVNSMGRYIDNTKTFTDVVGRRRQIGTAKWVPGTGQRGTADVHAVLKGGKALFIEIKINDRQSDFQRDYQHRVEGVGATYLIVRSFAQFLSWYNENTGNE